MIRGDLIKKKDGYDSPGISHPNFAPWTFAKNGDVLLCLKDCVAGHVEVLHNNQIGIIYAPYFEVI